MCMKGALLYYRFVYSQDEIRVHTVLHSCRAPMIMIILSADGALLDRMDPSGSSPPQSAYHEHHFLVTLI